MEDKIKEFKGDYRWLSNFYPCIIEYEGIKYPTIEHAYMAQKTKDIELKYKISLIETPGKAKRYAKTIVLDEEWDKVKLEIMEKLLRLKFKQEKFRFLLKNTKSLYLEEGNSWGDCFWGVCNGKGKNNLGKLLMKIRAEI